MKPQLSIKILVQKWSLGYQLRFQLKNKVTIDNYDLSLKTKTSVDNYDFNLKMKS